MSKVVIVGDDLTGLNSTCVLLARQGFRAGTFLGVEGYSQNDGSEFNIFSISTDSRGVPREEAYKRVSEVISYFRGYDVKLFSKRIDSTLRGNIGAEIEAVLDTLDNDEIAVIVPAFPTSGRITIGGYQMVNSILLENTDVAKDPKCPIRTSYVPDLVKEQTKYGVGYISIDKVLQGEVKLKDLILEEKRKGNRMVIVDAVTNEEIDTIAKACKSTGVPIISVDPGPFTAALAGQIMDKPNTELGQKVMLTIGSVSNLTRKQIEELKVKYSPLLVTVDSLALVYEDKREKEINRVVDTLIDNMKNYSIFGAITAVSEDEVLNLSEIARELNVSLEEVSVRISDGLAKITRILLDKTDSIIGGLYTSGGDVTVAVCKELQSNGIELKDEILPLAVYGRLIKGKYDNKPIITKGGLIGDQTALIKCVDYLLTKISNEYHIKI